MNRITQLAINDEGFIFDPATGESFTVNQTGLAVLKALKDGLPPRDAALLLTERFDVPLPQAERDTAAFADTLRAAAWL